MELQSVWGWQPALYLFLGGMGAGAFIMAAVLYLKDRERHGRIVCVSMWAATISLVVGLLLLLMELVTPLRGLLMWQSFSHFTSWMTYGAWGAFGAIVAFGLSALFATESVSAWLKRAWPWYEAHEAGIRRVFAIAGIVLGAFVAFYTGMLLMASENVPFWNTLLLPALFTVSAFDTGVALVEVVAAAVAKREQLERDAKVFVERCVVALVGVEAVVLVAFLASMLAADASTAVGAAAVVSAMMFVMGDLAVFFWVLVVALGLALPFAMALRGLLREKKVDAGAGTADEAISGADAQSAPASRVDAYGIVGAAGALVGGCALRFLVLAAGIHADVVAETVMKMIG